MQCTTPGMTEAQLESVFEHSCRMGGAQWLSFPPVVAGGERALSLHYIKNDQILKYITCVYYSINSDTGTCSGIVNLF